MFCEDIRKVGGNTDTTKRKLGQPEPPSESTGWYRAQARRPV